MSITSLKESSIIFGGLPYFIDGMGADWDNTSLQHKASRAGVVGSLPVGMKFDSEQGRKFQRFMEPALAEFYRVLKPGGFAVIFSQARLYGRLAVAAEDAGFEIRDMLSSVPCDARFRRPPK